MALGLSAGRFSEFPLQVAGCAQVAPCTPSTLARPWLALVALPLVALSSGPCSIQALVRVAAGCSCPVSNLHCCGAPAHHYCTCKRETSLTRSALLLVQPTTHLLLCAAGLGRRYPPGPSCRESLTDGLGPPPPRSAEHSSVRALALGHPGLMILQQVHLQQPCYDFCFL